MIPKQTFNIVFFLIIIVFSNNGAFGTNLFQNSGFEKKIRLSLWPLSTSSTITRDEKIFKDGKASARIDISEIQNKTVLYTYVRLQPNKTYIISFWYKLKNWKKLNNHSTKISLLFNKKNGRNGSAGRFAIPFPSINKPGSVWKKFTAEFTTPSDTCICQLGLLYAQGVTGTLWFDNIKLEQVIDSLSINRTLTSPKIDGILDDPCWKHAIPISHFYRLHSTGEPAEVQTNAYICYDNNFIYIAFQNVEPEITTLKTNVTERDGSVWQDDCDEIFLAAPNRKIRQFIISASNVQWDAELYMQIPGDPYKAKPEWNSKLKSAVKIHNNKWIAEVAIPFSSFNYSAQGLWRINLARERQGGTGECTLWNRTSDRFNNVDKFGFLKFGKNSANLSRFSENIIKNPFHIERPAAKFKELLSQEPGNYIVGSWEHGGYLKLYPQSYQNKCTSVQWKLEQEQYFTEIGRAGMFAYSFPRVDELLSGGMDKVRELNKKYDMKFSYGAIRSYMWQKAIRNGAVFVADYGKFMRPDPTDPEMAKVAHCVFENYLKKRPDIIPYLAVINGEDEPTNRTYRSFSFTSNHKNKKSLDIIDAKIKKDFGFGKFGIYDYYEDTSCKRHSAFKHIAFWSWWSEEYYKIRNKDREIAEHFAPGIPYLVNFNSCSAFRYPDFTRISFALHYISCDPYPTATMALSGRNRALYHTGFSTKLMHDIVAPGVKVCIMPQGFIYHGHGPTPENIREWASQAMKNGASMLYWYTRGPLRITIPDSYKEMLRINNLVRSMKKLNLPKKTVTALFFSQNTRRGIMDETQYSLYTLYVLLGEKLQTWFRFVNETMLKLNIVSLDSYSIVYVPELKYIDKATAMKLLKFVKNGGILVLFDPESFTFNIDGTRMNDFRSKLIGANIGKRHKSNSLILTKTYQNLKQGSKLPLTAVRGRAGAGEILSFDIQPPEDANVFAAYPDGKPAAYERKVGKGKVIYFAAQPFGNATLATCKSSWETFFSGLAKEVGEPENLAIWDFLLPPKGGEIEVKYIVQP